jgi:hypothetical protein
MGVERKFQAQGTNCFMKFTPSKQMTTANNNHINLGFYLVCKPPLKSFAVLAVQTLMKFGHAWNSKDTVKSRIIYFFNFSYSFLFILLLHCCQVNLSSKSCRCVCHCCNLSFLVRKYKTGDQSYKAS